MSTQDDIAEERRRRMYVEIQRLKAKLEKYGSHLQSCKTLTGTCTCGLEEK